MSDSDTVPDVRKSVSVGVSAAEAFRIFTSYPGEWLPPGHTFIAAPAAVAMEPRMGGRFYERDADGTDVVRGTILEWFPANRLVMTWRVGADWQPILDDEQASLIEVDFVATGDNTADVVVTNTHLDRLGDFARQLRGALAAANPGETLQRYADTVARHSTTARV